MNDSAEPDIKLYKPAKDEERNLLRSTAHIHLWDRLYCKAQSRKRDLNKQIKPKMPSYHHLESRNFLQTFEFHRDGS
jgi:hypothetical protein